MTSLERNDDCAGAGELLWLPAVPSPVKRDLLRGDGGADRPALQTVVVRWRRARELGADQDGVAVAEGAVVDAAVLRESRERVESLLRAADSVLGDFAATCASRDFSLLLTDAEGVVVRSTAGGGFAEHAARLRLVEGGLWTEALRGTNAIGTAIAEQRPVAIQGAAHYARVNEGLVCYAAPIRDPYGRLAAVLDATSFVERGGALEPSAVLTVARAIEEVLRVRSYAGAGQGLPLVERLLERAREPAFLIERPGRVVRANAAARAWAAEQDAVALLPRFDELAAIAGRGGGMRDDGSQLQVEALVDSDARILALLVFVVGAPRVAARPVRVAGQGASARAFAPVLGDDPGITAARDRAARLAASALPILLLAETGSGKELFARAIHDASPRAAGPFVPVNCGAIPESLLASELFGHGAGAFTGAAKDGRAGRIAAADGGTLFLDEIAELSAEAQVMLLRVLEDGSYYRVGEDRPRRADIRVVAATCGDLRAMVADGRFREDLFFRVGGARVEIPPLRSRRDLDRLIDAFLARMTVDGRVPELRPAARAALAAHRWPGNVRELKSVLEYAVVMAGDDPVEVEHLPFGTESAPAPSPSVAVQPAPLSLHESERDALQRALEAADGNVSAVARQLGVARSTVYRMLRRHGIDG